MSVRVMEAARQSDLVAHIRAVSKLGTGELQGIERLAQQIHGQNVLPVLGAGASFDCGMRLAREIAEDLYGTYKSDPAYAPHDPHLGAQDLAGIAEAIFVRTNSQSRVVSELGLPDPDRWRPAETMGEHFCVYRVLARMVREGFLAEAFGFNYDCGVEAGLSAEGFAYGDIASGRWWIDRARIVADGATNASTVKDDSSFTLYKANGCAAKYRELAEDDEEAAAEGIVVRTDQINRWKDSAWSRNPFRNRAENHVLMLVGFAAQDPKFSAELRGLLEAVYREAAGNGQPRVVAIDHAPNPTEIEALIRSGLDGQPPAAGVVTRICTEGSTATAALLMLLVELLEIELGGAFSAAEVELPDDLDARLAFLLISGPTMRRWAYLMEASDENLIQRANVISERGYVPLSVRPDRVARLAGARSAIRAQLGFSQPEGSEEALSDHGFIVNPSRGLAFMPVGIEQAALSAICRPGAELERLKAGLDGQFPSQLDCVLVSGDGSDLAGVNLATGKEVSLV